MIATGACSTYRRLSAITLVCVKDSVYFTLKNLLFLFYIITFTKYSHQFIYYIHFFIKIIFFLNFFIISHPPSPNPSFPSEYTPFFFAPSLSLSSPLFFLPFLLLFIYLRIFFFPLLYQPITSTPSNRSPLTQISVNPLSISINTNSHQHRSTSTHHRSPSTPIHIIDPNRISNP